MTATILKQIGNFNEEQVRLFESKIVYRKLSKDEIVLPEGGVCSSVFYNLSGALYQFNYKADNELNVVDLHLDREWFLNASSFFNQKPSDCCIKAFTDCSIFELSVFRLHELIAVSPVFLQLGKVLEHATSRVHFFDNLMTPLQKYQFAGHFVFAFYWFWVLWHFGGAANAWPGSDSGVYDGCFGPGCRHDRRDHQWPDIALVFISFN
ncbi:MAG: hypothetical protein SFV55_06840 [Haliscomenobacter sp.]|uniref:Crp/Fnr family transcriptional regulator n=1 Tax=Haliscomenobacter sp. TaxID=2717303 RepID=UPI0029BAD66A|nr:hypothetical protein [Haliscomenobacter sp.]MDX2068125.1 hypothetical protein [Haliscomenobacter sp.]